MTYISMIPLHELLGHLPPGSQFRGLKNPDTLHRATMRLFGPLPINDSPRATAGVLFRVEPVEDTAPFALIRSKFAPVVATSGLRTREEPSAPDTGALVSFRISLNAVRVNSKRAGVTPVPETELLDYIDRALSAVLSDIAVMNHTRTKIGLKNNGRTPVQIDLIDGIGTIVDQAALQTALGHGIGRAKNFGCGMLTVRAL